MRRQRAVHRNTGPVIGPCLVPIRSNTDHRLNGEAHARLSLPNSLVLRIVRNVGRAMKQLVDAMSTVRSDHSTFLALRILLDDVAILAEECARLDHVDSLVQTFSRRLRHSYSVWVC